MSQRTIGLGILCLALGISSGEPRAWADVISVTENSGFSFAQTDYAPGSNIGANDPITFGKFLPGAGGIPSNAVLESVGVSFDWGFQSQLSASFPFNSNPASTISINSFGNITVGKPDTKITSPNDPSNLFLFPTQTFQNTTSFSSSVPGDFVTKPLSTYFHSLPPGYIVPEVDKPLNLQGAGPPLTTTILPASADFSKFLGPGTVTFDVVATAGYNIPNTSGNATGRSMTYAFPQMTLTYNYTVPEPGTLAVLGVGFGGLLLARHFRRRMAATGPDA